MSTTVIHKLALGLNERAFTLILMMTLKFLIVCEVRDKLFCHLELSSRHEMSCLRYAQECKVLALSIVSSYLHVAGGVLDIEDLPSLLPEVASKVK
jgi:hypothetical protein